jgi:hypothetical protein
MGRIAAERADRIAIKETRKYLRGREGEAIVDDFRRGIRAAGRRDDVPVYASETAALQAELSAPSTDGDGRAGTARVIVLLCQAERTEVFELLASLGARPVTSTDELLALAPRLQDRPRRA